MKTSLYKFSVLYTDTDWCEISRYLSRMCVYSSDFTLGDEAADRNCNIFRQKYS